MRIHHGTARFPALLAVTLLGCSSSKSAGTGADAGTGEKYLGLETPTDGFQVRDIGTRIAAGDEKEYCEVAELPGDPSDTYYVKSIELANGPRSHHLIVTAAAPGSPMDGKLRAMSIGDKVPCLSAAIAFGEDGAQGVGGIQQPYGRVDYPDGVGRVFHGGQRVVFDYHYFNSGTDAVDARSAFNFHLVKASDIQHEAKGFGFYNWTIDTPPGKTGAFKGECHFKNDVNVGGLTRHTHRWGTDYTVWYAGGAHDGEQIWKSSDWEHDVDHAFAPAVLMKAGEGFRFECDYRNDETHDLRFGTSATDEMCILFGLIWDAGDAREVPDQGCSITWVDSDGVGHAADEAGGFPKPADPLVRACLGGSSKDGGALDECATCRCTSCADPIVKCAVDTECQAVLGCFQSGAGDCQSVISEHSSAVGMLQQMQSCIETECTACAANASGADAGR